MSANPDGSIRRQSLGSEDDGGIWRAEKDLRWVQREQVPRAGTD